MFRFQTKLKALYGRQDKIEPLIEGLEEEIPPQSFKDHYSKPKMIIRVDNGKELQNYEPITNIEALFDPLTTEGSAAANKPQIYKLLIEGGPGVGKTTSMQYFAYKWSQGELWKDKFDYVYRVPLQMLLNRDCNFLSHRQDQDGDDDMLKCLVHYYLVTEEKRFCKLEDIPWKKEKTLLLIDGYDEVPQDKKYQKVFEEIFDHKNIILASRPNAINKKTAEKFGRKIENTGFDHDGINHYLTKYFEKDKAKGLEFEEYLEKNPFIKEICNIPVIIAMLCFIWCGDAKKSLCKVSNLSDLYHQMMNQIGFRNYAKQECHLGKSQEELANEWKEEAIYLDELRVLQHLAFKRMTSGDTWQRSKPQIFPGMKEPHDRDGISIKSSINSLSDVLKKKRMPTIKDVCKFGLLKSERVPLKENLSENDLTKLNFSFTHFSFQEFLTARYFAEMMNENNHQYLVNFITRHRNNPLYLMTFKFLAGILSSAKGEKAEQNIKIFWDVILCNTDGVLELGVETKVSLLMHLLSQTRKGEQIDKRIPHKEEAVKLIDCVVLGNLSGWKTQLRESDYTSDNIREGLIEYFVNGKVNWLSEKSLQLKKQINPNSKREISAHVVSQDDIIDIIGRMIHKFSETEVEEIFFKDFEFLKNFNETKWRQTKKAAELFIMINRKSDLEDVNKEQVFNSLLKLVHDDNLNEISSKAMKELISKPQNLPLAHKLLKAIREGFEDVTTEAQYKRMWTRVKLGKICGLCDMKLAQDILNVLIQLTTSSNQDIEKLASKNFIRVVEVLSKDESQLVRYAVGLLLPLLNDPKYKWKVKISTSNTLEEIMKFSDNTDNELFEDAFYALSSLLQDSNRDVTILMSRRIRKLVMMTSNNHNTQLVKDALKIFKKLLQNSDAHLKGAISNNIVELIKKKGWNDDRLSRDVREALILLLKNPDLDISTSASINLIELLKVDPRFIGNIVHDLIPIFEGSEKYVDYARQNALNTIIELITISDSHHRIQLARSTLDKLVEFWRKTVLDGKKKELEVILKLIEIIGDRSKEFLRNLMKLFSPFFMIDPNPGNKISALNCLTEVVKEDMEFTLKAIKIFQLPLKDDDLDVRKTASKSIMLLVRENKEKYPRLEDDTIKDLLESSENAEWNVKTSVAEIVGGLQSGSIQTDLVHQILDLLTPLLQYQDPTVRITASNAMIEFLKKIGKRNSDFVQKVSESFTLLLKDRNSNVKMTASDNLRELMDISGHHFLRDVIRTLASLAYSQDAKFYIQNIGEFNMKELFKMKNKNGVQVIQEILKTLLGPLKDDDRKVRILVSKKIVELIILGDPNYDQLFQEAVKIFEPLLSSFDWNSTDLASSSLIEVLKKRNNQEPHLVQKIINVLTRFLGDDDGHFLNSSASASHHLIEIMKRSGNGCENPQLCGKIFNILKAHLKVHSPDLNMQTSKDLIKLAMIKSENVTVFGVRTVIEEITRAPRVWDLDQNLKTIISNDIVALLKVKSKNNVKLLENIIDELCDKLERPNVNLVEMSSNILKGAFLIMLENPEDTLPKYFRHSSKKVRGVLISTLVSCLKTYVQNFHSLDELFRGPKSSLTLEKITKLFNPLHLTHETSQSIQIYLDSLQKKGFPDEDVSKFKMFLASKLDRIESVEGSHIIKPALIIANKENESQSSSNHQELIELAKEVLNIQVKYLNDGGLTWISNNHDQLLSLSPETKFFYRKVCDKMLEDNVITPCEEKLMIKFINQGLTASLTRSGEVIFEETCYKLKGDRSDDIEQALEKMAKTIIRQQQDILAHQYKENKPIFAKNFIPGMKEAAVDKKDVKSIVDSRFFLENDSWLLTILNPKKSTSEIVILEHRSAFGDHFLYHLSDQKILRWYPDEIPALKHIFGGYVRGEFYRGEIKKLRDEDGQKLFESKDKNEAYRTQGELISNQIYFQQELLGGGWEDRNQFTGDQLDTKLDDNRKVFENYVKRLNLLDMQKKQTLEYYEGLVSTFVGVYISSLTITVGKVAIDDGIDFFSLSNLFKQLCSFIPFGIGGLVFDTVDTIRGHLIETPIRNNANFVKDIAIDPVEASDLIGKIVEDIISDPKNRQRIFDAKEKQQVTDWLEKIKDWVLKQLKKLKKKVKDYKKFKNLFLEEIKTTPAFQLGINDANKIITEWIAIKQANPHLRMHPAEKLKIFKEVVVANEI